MPSFIAVSTSGACPCHATTSPMIRTASRERYDFVRLPGVQYATVGDRPDPHPPPHARGARGPSWRAEPPIIDAGPREPGRLTRAARARRHPDRPLSTAPSPRHHAATFGVSGRPTGASDRAPSASPPTGTAVRTAHEARERSDAHAAARRSVLAPYARRRRDRPRFKLLSRPV